MNCNVKRSYYLFSILKVAACRRSRTQENSKILDNTIKITMPPRHVVILAFSNQCLQSYKVDATNCQPGLIVIPTLLSFNRAQYMSTLLGSEFDSFCFLTRRHLIIAQKKLIKILKIQGYLNQCSEWVWRSNRQESFIQKYINIIFYYV